MGPTSTNREVIHVAFGNSSCHLSAHLLNLQGLAATTASTNTTIDDYGDDHDDNEHQRWYPLCCPHVTHTYSSRSGTRASWVPRALLVDRDDDDDGDSYGDTSHGAGQSSADDAVLDAIRSDGGSLIYHGNSSYAAIETLSKQALSGQFRSMLEDGDNVCENDEFHRYNSTTSSSSHLPLPNSDLQSKRRKPPTNGTTGTSSSPFEKRRPPVNTGAVLLLDARYNNTASSAMTELLHPRRHYLSPSDQQKSLEPQRRHVDWDDELADEQEPDSDDEDHDNDAARARLRRQQLQMKQQRILQEQQRMQQQQHHAQLEEMWNQTLDPSSLLAPTDSQASDDAPANRRAPSWKDFYRMAPHAPSSILSAPANDSTASLLRDEVEDRFRALLEGCDSCQGMVHVASPPSSSSDSSSAVSVEAQQLLDFHKEECNSGRRFSIFMNPALVGLSPQQVARHHVLKACHWSHLVENSTAVLPLQEWHASSSNAASAIGTAMLLASALEAVKLPYRVHPEASSSTYRQKYGTGLAINSVDGYNDDAHLPMSLASFLAALTPSPAHTVLELDAYTPLDGVLADGDARQASSEVESNASDMVTPIQSWSSQLLQGTAVERRILSSSGRGESRRSLGVHPPGSWLQQKSSHGGLVTLWSPRGSAAAPAAQRSDDDDRSRHQHFALMASLRTGATTSSSTGRRANVNESSSSIYQLDSVDDYLTCLMQGMGIRYRPEQSMANVVTRQSLNQLVHDSAVGTYWKAMLKTRTSGTAAAAAVNNAPVIAVLGNSTRSYAFLSDVAAQMKDVVVAPRRTAAASGGSTSFTSMRNGWYRRDAALGLVPEEDDCLEALSQCLDVRDRYRPPHPAPQDDEDVDGEDF